MHHRAGQRARDPADALHLRDDELAELVGRAIERIESGSAEAAMPPMSSYERKLVHDLVSERGFHSESRGEGSERHTVISRGA